MPDRTKHDPVALSGLLGNNCLNLLERVQRQVLQPGALVVPAAATMYCVAVELLSGLVQGFDMAPLNKFRCVCMHVESHGLADPSCICTTQVEQEVQGSLPSRHATQSAE